MKTGSKDELAKLDVLPFPESICHRCTNRRTIATKTSTFLMCTALAVKYPRHPYAAAQRSNLPTGKTRRRRGAQRQRLHALGSE